MRIKLLFLLIFSSLTSLSFAQKLTTEDFQGLWYRIDEDKKNYDSLYNLKYEKIIYPDTYRDSIDVIQYYNEPSLRRENFADSTIGHMLAEITVLTAGYVAKYGCEEPLDVFEIIKNAVKFYSNVYYSEIIYTRGERYDLEKRYGYKFISENEGEIYETRYRIKDDTLFFKRYDSDTWVQNEILYYKNDTLVLRNSAQNLFNVYVKKAAENINYKILEMTSHRAPCFLGNCPGFIAEITTDRKVSYTYDNSWGRPHGGITIYDGEKPSGKISKHNMDELFHLLNYFDVTGSDRRFCIGMTDAGSRSLTFKLNNGEEIEIKDFHKSGPPVLRVVDEMIYKFMKELVSKKYLPHTY